MVQLLNILYFLMELTFGRDASARRTRGQTLRAMAVLVIAGASLYGNYWLVKERFKASINSVALKEQMADYEELKKQNANLALKVQTLEGVIATLGPLAGARFPQAPGPKSPQPVNNTVLPVLPLRSDTNPPERDKEYIKGR